MSLSEQVLLATGVTMVAVAIVAYASVKIHAFLTERSA